MHCRCEQALGSTLPPVRITLLPPEFGIGRRNDGTNIFAQLSEVLGGQTASSPGALVSAKTSAGTTSSGRFVNSFSKKWNYKVGYGLIDATAAVNRMLGQ